MVKYITKMFSPTKFLISECIFQMVCFCESVEDQGYISRKRICWKIFGQIVTGIDFLHVFLITMHENGTATEAYSEPFQRYIIEFFSKNS